MNATRMIPPSGKMSTKKIYDGYRGGLPNRVYMGIGISPHMLIFIRQRRALDPNRFGSPGNPWQVVPNWHQQRATARKPSNANG